MKPSFVVIIFKYSVFCETFYLFIFYGIFSTYVLLESILALYKNPNFALFQRRSYQSIQTCQTSGKTFQLSSFKTHRYLSSILVNRTKYGFQKQNEEKHIYIKKSRYCQSSYLFSKNEKCQRMLFFWICFVCD